MDYRNDQKGVHDDNRGVCQELYHYAEHCHCRGKVIQRHENHPMGTEATLIYNLGPVSWGYNLVRRGLGIVWGISGQAIYHTLEYFLRQVSAIILSPVSYFLAVAWGHALLQKRKHLCLLLHT